VVDWFNLKSRDVLWLIGSIGKKGVGGRDSQALGIYERKSSQKAEEKREREGN